MTETPYRSVLMDSLHARADFRCGVDALDRYFHHQAMQDRRRSVSAPYVLVDRVTGSVLGYYTLSTASIPRASLPEVLTRRLPKYETLPVLLVGRLAVDLRYRGRGIGRLLLLDALSRCLDTSREVGLIGVLVDAKDDTARAFYEHHGFLRLVDREHTLFLPIATIAALEL